MYRARCQQLDLGKSHANLTTIRYTGWPKHAQPQARLGELVDLRKHKRVLRILRDRDRGLAKLLTRHLPLGEVILLHQFEKECACGSMDYGLI